MRPGRVLDLYYQRDAKQRFLLANPSAKNVPLNAFVSDIFPRDEYVMSLLIFTLSHPTSFVFVVFVI